METDGGTPFDAMQRYEPISLREIFVSFKTSPRKEDTINLFKMCEREKENTYLKVVKSGWKIVYVE